MWTPTPSINGRINSPALNSSDWRKIKAGRQTRSKIDLHHCLVNEPPMALQIGSGSINQKPLIEPGRLSTRSACWTVLSIFVGLGLLSKPYAIAKGGWISIPILAFLTVVSNKCGKLIVDCYNTPQCRGSTSYGDVANQVFGYWGAVFLILMIVLEWLAGVCICLLFIWANLEAMMTWVPRLYIVIISTAVTLPTVWVLKLSDAWWLTLLGFLAILCVVLTLLYVAFSYGELEDVDLDNTFGPNIPLSTGIFMLSLSGHSALPQVYREMSKPQDFNWVMDFSCFIMFVIYVGAGVSGYMIYGYSTDIIISTSMVKNPGGIMPKIVSLLVVLKNFLTVNPFIAVLCDSSEVMMGIEEACMKQRIFRSFTFLAAAGLSYLAYDALPFLESISSAVCVMLTSFILPATFFLQLKGKTISMKTRIMCVCIFILSVIMMGVLTYGSIISLMHPDK